MSIITLTLNPAIDRSVILESELIPGSSNTVLSNVVTPGGKGVNCSRLFSMLGKDVPCYGFAGGKNGKQLEDMLYRRGIETRFTHTEAETRLNFKITSKNGVETQVNEKGGVIKESELNELEKKILSADFDTILICGSLPMGIPDDYYAFLTKSLKKKGKKVILDTSNEPLRLAVEEQPFLIKPNKEEFFNLTGECVEKYNAYAILPEFYRSTGIEVILSLGGDGAYYCGEKGLYEISVPKVKAKGFTGAGDTLLAAYVYGMGRYEFEYQLKFCASAAYSKVCLEGAHLPTKDEVKANIDKIKVYPVK